MVRSGLKLQNKILTTGQQFTVRQSTESTGAVLLSTALVLASQRYWTGWNVVPHQKLAKVAEKKTTLYLLFIQVIYADSCILTKSYHLLDTLANISKRFYSDNQFNVIDGILFNLISKHDKTELYSSFFSSVYSNFRECEKQKYLGYVLSN